MLKIAIVLVLLFLTAGYSIVLGEVVIFTLSRGFSQGLTIALAFGEGIIGITLLWVILQKIRRWAHS